MSFGAFLLAYALVVVTPGPNALIVLQSAATDGRRAALRTALGAAVGAGSLAALVLLVGRNLPATPDQLAWLRLIFGGLLIHGGLGCFRRRAVRTVPCGGTAPMPPGQNGPPGALRGMMVAIGNPFTGVFILSANPLPFGGPAAGLLAVPVAVMAIAGTWLCLLATVATSGPTGRLLLVRQRTVIGGLGVVLLAMGLHIVVSTIASP